MASMIQRVKQTQSRKPTTSTKHSSVSSCHSQPCSCTCYAHKHIKSIPSALPPFYSDMTSPLIAFDSIWSPACPPLSVLGPSPGCLMPSAAPSILFPGLPIRGADPPLVSELAARTAGSLRIVSSVKEAEEEIIALKVGCAGIDGRVGEGSRTKVVTPFVSTETTGCSGIEPLIVLFFICPLRTFELAIRECPFDVEIEPRELCPRDALL